MELLELQSAVHREKFVPHFNLNPDKAAEKTELKTIGECFLRSCRENWDGNFVRHAGGRSIPYRETVMRVAGIVKYFQDQGIGQGDRVVCYWEETIPALDFALACAMTGVIFVPLSPLFSVHYLKNLQDQNDAKRIFTTPERMAQLQEGGLEPIAYDDLSFGIQDESVSEKIGPSSLSPDKALAFLTRCASGIQSSQTFMIQPTSGSTGKPKLVLRSHASPLRYAKFVGPEIDHGEGNRPRFLMVAALTHAFGFNMLTLAMSVGAELLVPNRIDAAASLEEVRRLDPTVIPLVPRILKSFFQQQNQTLQSGETPGATFGPGARFLISAGGSCNPDLFHQAAAQGLCVLELYGASEASLIAMTPRGGWKPGFAGKPLPDEDLKIDLDGEILVRSPGVMESYFNDPDLTRDVFTSDGFYRTGDLGRLDAQGYLQILGRKRDVFNTSDGSNIYPERIETLLETIPAVSQALLVGDRQPYLSAILVVNAGSSSGDRVAGAGAAILNELSHEDFYRRIGMALKQINSRLERVEQVVRFVLLSQPFHPDVYQLVGPGKVRRGRKAATDKYAEVFQKLYFSENPANASFVPGIDRRLRPRTDLRVHLVWTPNNRQALLTGRIGEKTWSVLQDLCAQNNLKILVGDVAPDHVHLFLSYPPELSVNDIVCRLKGPSSDRIFQSLPELFSEKVEKNLWEKGFLAVTSGAISDETIHKYTHFKEELTA